MVVRGVFRWLSFKVESDWIYMLEVGDATGFVIHGSLRWLFMGGKLEGCLVW